MKTYLKDLGIVTADLPKSRDFYVNHFGFQAVYDSDWYCHLKNGEVEIGLLKNDTPNQPGFFHQPYAGAGIWISLGVDDVDAEYARLVRQGLNPEAAPEDKPWGERCFVVRDPNGLALNISKPIAATMAM